MPVRPALPLLALAAACGPGSGGAEASDTAAPFEEGPGTLTGGGVVTCADPAARDTFGPLAEDALGPDWDLQAPVGWAGGEYWHGEGLAVEDLTGDGRLDVLVPDKSALRFYTSTPDGSWAEESAARIPPFSAPDGVAALATATPADIDGDGFVDIVVGRAFYGNVVLRNRGDGTFEDVTAASGLPTTTYRPRGTPLGDIDGDGDLDLLVVNDREDEFPPEPAQPNLLYENQGDGTFRDISDRLTYEDTYGYTKVAAFLDFDADGAQDLYIVNHLPQFLGNRLRLNRGDGTFETVPEAGLDLAVSGMGLSFTDLDGDGLPDVAVSGFEEVVLLQSVAPRAWALASAARGIDPGAEQYSAWGNTFEDLDNDGRPDLLVTFGQAGVGEVVGPNPEEQPDALWIQQPDGTFREEAAAWGLDDPAVGRAVAAVDLDDDGWLDVLAHGHNEETRFLRARCGAASWVKVRVRGAAPNTLAIGARVRIEAAGRWHTRWVQAGGMLFTHVPAEVHVGLGDVDTIDRLVVDWPDGTTSEWRGLDARQAYIATQEAG